jgi:putative transposase
MKKFQNKYRIPSARAPSWNYANNGAYFITICAAGGECLFGEIENNEMRLSETGVIVQQEWEKSFEMRAELFCDAFVIMPNHIHAIVRMDHHGPKTAKTRPPAPTQTQNRGVAHRLPKSISSFVAGFKSSATKRIHKWRNAPKQPVWQTRFHDHIIRNDDDYFHIKNYIETNPSNWETDTFS